MILEKLVQHYDSLTEDEDANIAPLGYSSAKVSFAINISSQGTLLGLIDLRQEAGKKMIPRKMIVPLQEKRTAGEKPYFLCDKSKYIFGFDGETCAEHFSKFKDLQTEILAGIDDEEAAAVINFINSWDPVKIHEFDCIEERLDDVISASSFVFRLEGKKSFVHENATIKKVWEDVWSKLSENIWELISSKSNDVYVAQCLVTGENTAIAKIHQSIMNVHGAQQSGAAIVSFNINSFISYNKEQSYNAPISKMAMLKYTTALNHLLASQDNKIRLGDCTTVFWAEGISHREEAFLKMFLEPQLKTKSGRDSSDKESEKLESETEVEENVATILEGIRKGKNVKDILPHPDLNFYILGLAPNSSRLSIRFWMVDSFGSLVERIALHYSDMNVVRPPNAFIDVPTWVLLREIAVLGKAENIPNTIITSLSYSIFSGANYPESIFPAVIGRIRADKTINYQRAGLIKAFLIRNRSLNKKEEVITMALNSENKTPAYLLGRLFSLLEKVQNDAAGGNLNATIKDRFFGSASATPAIVFPQLLRLSQHHVSKAEYGNNMDKKIREVINDLDGFPKQLSLEDQGIFILGYYHQKQANYESKSETKE